MMLWRFTLESRDQSGSRNHLVAQCGGAIHGDAPQHGLLTHRHARDLPPTADASTAIALQQCNPSACAAMRDIATDPEIIDRWGWYWFWNFYGIGAGIGVLLGLTVLTASVAGGMLVLCGGVYFFT